MNASTYEHDYGHIPTDDVGIAVALAMTENRRPGLSLSTLTEAEHMEGTLDTTQLESGTTTAPELMLTPSTPSTTATSLTRDALANALDMARNTLAPRIRGPVTAPAVTAVTAPGVQARPMRQEEKKW